MLHPASATDVHVLANGRKATARFSYGTGMALRFTSSGKTTDVSSANIKRTVVGAGELGVCLSSPQRILPGSVNPVESILLSRPLAAAPDAWDSLLAWCAGFSGSVDYSTTSFLTTACERTRVQIGCASSPIVVWTGNTCTAVDDLKAVVLQRTTGGMSTYDAHIIPCRGSVVTVDMLPHGTLSVWAEVFGADCVVNAGADPVRVGDIQHAQFVPSVRDYIMGIHAQTECASSCEESSEWNGDESSESESSESSESSEMYESSESS